MTTEAKELAWKLKLDHICIIDYISLRGFATHAEILDFIRHKGAVITDMGLRMIIKRFLKEKIITKSGIYGIIYKADMHRISQIKGEIIRIIGAD